MAQFRFMNLEIWQDSISINDQLFDLANQLENAKQFRVAEQLRGASLSISNNIAVVAFRQNFIDENQLNQILNDLDLISRKITNFRKSILNNN